MKTTHLCHASGGRILEIVRVEHSTDDGVGYWGFRGVVQWKDRGNRSSLMFGPQMIYCDGSNAEAKAELDKVMGALELYLCKAGRWHDMKHKRDGRAYSWTPKKIEGWESIEALISEAAKVAA